MEEPPFLIDGTRVLEFAILDYATLAATQASVVVSGVALDFNTLRGVAICENLVKDGVFAVHCNERWETVAADRYPQLDAARSGVDAVYGMALPWQPYRDLSPQERSQLETTRAFLKELAAEFPEQ